MVTHLLSGDEDCKNYFPIRPNTKDLFTILKDGVVLCKLNNCIQKGTIDERVINKKDDMSNLDKEDNLNLAIASSKSLGLPVNDVTPSTVTNQKYPAILGYLWQLFKVILSLNFIRI